jgi:hypothetical protein
VNDEELVKWADDRRRWMWAWATWYGSLHDWFSFISWAGAIAVPFGLAVMLYLPPEQRLSWNVWLLIASGVGLLLQTVAMVMRLRDRANSGWKAVAALESAVLRFRNGTRTKEDLLNEIDQVLKDQAERPGP